MVKPRKAKAENVPTLDGYTIMKYLGEGTSGRVFMAKHKILKTKVALKMIKTSRRDYQRYETTMEAQMLNTCAHENIVKLLDVVPGDKDEHENTLFLAMEFVPKTLFRAAARLTAEKRKLVMQKLLSAVKHCHNIGVLHLDIKMDNILVDSQCTTVKLADFGLSKDINNLPNPHYVYSLIYRAPELLLGYEYYGFAADMWATGCVFAALLLKGEYFFNCNTYNDNDKDEKELLQVICSICGIPTEESWPGVSQLPLYSRLWDVKVEGEAPGVRQAVKERLKRVDNAALDLLEQMLQLDPSKRITAENALQSKYFMSLLNV